MANDDDFFFNPEADEGESGSGTETALDARHALGMMRPLPGIPNPILAKKRAFLEQLLAAWQSHAREKCSAKRHKKAA